MKSPILWLTFWCILVEFVISSGNTLSPEEALKQIVQSAKEKVKEDSNEVVINDGVDELVASLNNHTTASGWDTIPLPGQSSYIMAQIPTFKQLRGNLVLKNGSLQGLNTTVRLGNSVVSSSKPNTISLAISLNFTNIKYDYPYKFSIIFINQEGTLSDNIEGASYTVVIDIDKQTSQISLERIQSHVPILPRKSSGLRLPDFLWSTESQILNHVLHNIKITLNRLTLHMFTGIIENYNKLQ